MRHELKLRLLWLVAVLSVAAAAALLLAGFKTQAETQAWLVRKRGDIGQLQALEAELKAGREAIVRLESRRGKVAPSLRQLLDTHGAGLNASEGAETRVTLSEGWKAVRKVVIVPDAPVAEVLRFVAQAESSAPPWRLVKLVLRPAATAGRGRTELTFETLE